MQKLAVPIAIVIAGALIALALYFATGRSNAPVQNNNSGTTALTEIRGVQQDDHVLGNPNADIVLVEYSDPECPYCKQFHGTMHQVIDEYGPDGKVAWVYRHFPLPQLHPKAPKEAEALECAYAQGGDDAFWAYTDRIYEITPSNNGLDLEQLPVVAEDVGLDVGVFNECLDNDEMTTRVRSDFDEAVAAGGRGTPFTVFTFDQKIPAEINELVSELNIQFASQIFTVVNDTQVSMSGALDAQVISLIVNTYIESQ